MGGGGERGRKEGVIRGYGIQYFNSLRKTKPKPLRTMVVEVLRVRGCSRGGREVEERKGEERQGEERVKGGKEEREKRWRRIRRKRISSNVPVPPAGAISFLKASADLQDPG